LETKKPYLAKKPGTLKTLNAIVGAVAYLAKVGKAGKIIPFKNVEFYWDSEIVSDWKQDKANTKYKKEIADKMKEEIDRSINSR